MKQIALECKPDEALVKVLGVSRRQLIHQPNKGEVFNFLDKNQGKLGMVDEDPGSAWHRSFQHYSLIEEQFNCSLYTSSQNRLVVLKPRLEEWILQQADLSGLDPGTFGLPSTGKELHKVVNQRLEHFSRFLNALTEEGSRGMMYLRQIITDYFRDS